MTTFTMPYSLEASHLVHFTFRGRKKTPPFGGKNIKDFADIF